MGESTMNKQELLTEAPLDEDGILWRNEVVRKKFHRPRGGPKNKIPDGPGMIQYKKHPKRHRHMPYKYQETCVLDKPLIIEYIGCVKSHWDKSRNQKNLRLIHHKNEATDTSILQPKCFQTTKSYPELKIDLNNIFSCESDLMSGMALIKHRDGVEMKAEKGIYVVFTDRRVCREFVKYVEENHGCLVYKSPFSVMAQLFKEHGCGPKGDGKVNAKGSSKYSIEGRE